MMVLTTCITTTTGVLSVLAYNQKSFVAHVNKLDKLIVCKWIIINAAEIIHGEQMMSSHWGYTTHIQTDTVYT